MVLDRRLKVQAQELERKDWALTRVERRELAAFMRDQKTEQRVRERGDEAVMPSLADIAGLRRETRPLREIDLLSSFAGAQDRTNEPPDLLAAFSRAAQSSQEQRGEGGARNALDQARPGDAERRDDAPRNTEQKPDRQR